MNNLTPIRFVQQAAMRQGIILGAWGWVTLTMMKLSFSHALFSLVWLLMLGFTPLVCIALTFRTRQNWWKQEEMLESFSFTAAFLHSFFTCLCGAVWLATAVFVYLKYFDGGAFFEAYGRMLDTPEGRAAIAQLARSQDFGSVLSVDSPRKMAEAMQSVGASTYAALILYLSLIGGPVLGLITGIICKKNTK
ncbi:MAG: DUF4199 domain-containing protein [Alloprevotella sp.]